MLYLHCLYCAVLTVLLASYLEKKQPKGCTRLEILRGSVCRFLLETPLPSKAHSYGNWIFQEINNFVRYSLQGKSNISESIWCHFNIFPFRTIFQYWATQHSADKYCIYHITVQQILSFSKSIMHVFSESFSYTPNNLLNFTELLRELSPSNIHRGISCFSISRCWARS